MFKGKPKQSLFIVAVGKFLHNLYLYFRSEIDGPAYLMFIILKIYKCL